MRLSLWVFFYLAYSFFVLLLFTQFPSSPFLLRSRGHDFIIFDLVRIILPFPPFVEPDTEVGIAMKP